ncbi:aminotransferase class I/II-fold pyridoxal phosphate-dependent enzyme [Streptomyces sp. NPDC001941]|uniref:aminotransferase class I/II-fold pyridoxal phosphate-dependent enzyme n=1 Tax=Streptomyces sp. NPDC001941 TaxID=3154659 RepID=UPI003323E91A
MTLQALPSARLTGTADPGPVPLHLNEFPLPPLPSVARAIAEAGARAHRYPDFHPDSLAAVLAHWCGVPADRMVVGNGAVGVALQFLRAAMPPGGRLAYGWRNFDAYPMVAHMVGAEAVPVPLLPGGHQDLDALADAAVAGAGALVLCNPHNPTGTLVEDAAVADFLERVPASTLVLLDEAYAEFADRPGRADPFALVDRHPNVVVLRTFSKAYGLAGMRVGYGVGSSGLVAGARVHQLPYGISEQATAAVHASLRAEPELRTRIRTLTRTRDELAAELVAAGWRVPRSHANFLWLDHPEAAEDAHRRLAAARVRARVYPGEGLRLAVPQRSDVQTVVAALGSPAVVLPSP